ncbi:DUF6745 domain-containing protein [Nostoc sp. DedQUE07]|uniref:DUF6745 domain-containing protein n=1 Tax=Nostoc sp. DedQUE07 TaxID=3075392 RepID=UPI002AD4232C|nr:hypothetical protein [Nostoc sp. DedQUE07]MDZ8130681.1 hypothetical protein [Nostoc sp. DedQUE07]
MSNKKIEKLTPEQEALISVYKSKWENIRLSTQRIDRKKAESAVKDAYAMVGLPIPQITFCDSPDAACNWLSNHLSFQKIKNWENNQDTSSLNNLLFYHIVEKLQNPLFEQIDSKVYEQFGDIIYCAQGGGEPFNSQLYKHLLNKIESRVSENSQFPEEYRYLESQINDSFQPENHLWAAMFDFGFSVSGHSNFKKDWKIFQSLVQECGWIIEDSDFCVICDRPTKLLLDNQQRLHAEAEPAIEYADGFSVYAYHGVRLPEKYSKLPPTEWEAKWLLEEDDLEVRELLIEIIGYEGIKKELQAVELDSSQGYTLLAIGIKNNVEPIYLLKMTDNNTRKIDIKRLSVNVKSVQEAIFLTKSSIFRAVAKF